MKSLFLILSLFLNISMAHADELNKLGVSFYGSFLHTDRVPNALFFFSDIKDNDSFELRKALRNHDIDTVVLSSRGGSVWEGLNMAGIIHDKGLKTYIPEKGISEVGNCASACSFMFFGGSSRVADGNLGVHQFYSVSAKQNAQIGTTQSNAQFTVSEIIGFLNEFRTPPFVYERMFQQQEMYYFNDAEKQVINRNTVEITEEQKDKIYQFIYYFNLELLRLNKENKSGSINVSPPPNKKPETKPQITAPNVSDRDLVAQIQSELNRLNCSAGKPDGIIGNNTKAALKRYGAAVKKELTEDLLQSRSFLSTIRKSNTNCVQPAALPEKTKTSQPVISKDYLRIKRMYETGNGGSYGKLYAFNITASCNWGRVQQIWYAYQRGNWFHMWNPAGTSPSLQPSPANTPFYYSLFGRGESKVYRMAWNRFKAVGEGCTEITGILVQ